MKKLIVLFILQYWSNNLDSQSIEVSGGINYGTFIQAGDIFEFNPHFDVQKGYLLNLTYNTKNNITYGVGLEKLNFTNLYVTGGPGPFPGNGEIFRAPHYSYLLNAFIIPFRKSLAFGVNSSLYIDLGLNIDVSVKNDENTAENCSGYLYAERSGFNNFPGLSLINRLNYNTKIYDNIDVITRASLLVGVNDRICNGDVGPFRMIYRLELGLKYSFQGNGPIN